MGGSVFEKNIQVLKDRYPLIADYLVLKESDKIRIEDEEGLEAGVTDVCGKTVMCATKGGMTFQLDSLYDSASLLDVWFKTFGNEWDFETKVFMYGLGNGMYARKFLQSAREDCKMIIHEPSDILLRAALDNFDLTDVLQNPRIRIVFWPLYRNKKDIKMFYEEEIEYKDGLLHAAWRIMPIIRDSLKKTAMNTCSV